MILNKLTLSNYRQHRDMSVDFDGNLIAIQGSNGAGKSNFLGSIQFALTGEQPGANKKDLVSWGEKDGFVQLEFTHSGSACVIRRSINSAACSITVDGERTNGAKAVEAVLRDRFAIDKDLFRQVVFVRQAEVDAILFDEPRKRELAFQRLAGLGDTEKMYNVLGGLITKYEKPDNYDTYLDDAVKSLDATVARAADLKKKTDEMRAALDAMPPKEDMLAALQGIQGRIGAEKHRATLRSQLEQSKAALASAVVALESLEKDRHEERSVADLEASLELLKNASALRMRFYDAKSKLDSATQDVANAKATDAPTEDEITELEKRWNELSAKAAELESRKATLNEYIAVVNGDGNCPVCGSELTFDLSKRLRDELRSVSDELVNVESGIKDASSYKRKRLELDAKIRAVSVAENRLLMCRDAYESASKELFGKIPEDKVDAIEDDLAATRHALEARIAWERSVDEATRTVDTCRSSIANIETALGSGTDESDSAGLAEQAAVISDGIRRRDEAATMLATFVGTLDATNEQISASEKYIEDLKAKKSDADKIRDRVKTLSTVRQALHYAAIPRSLSQRIVGCLTDGVNGYLDLFSAPFTVEPAKEGVGFVCRFDDGRKLPDELPDASFLSGGQKVQLAVAFRFATYELFAQKLGLLVLDEPTAYLDDMAIGRFGDVLKKVMEAAKSMNVQILCATHHRQVSAQADQVIDL